MSPAVPLESQVQREIELAIGAMPGVLCLRNNVGRMQDVRGRWVAYGLGDGSPDLVCIVDGRCVGLEVKRPGVRAEPHQARCHDRWRAFGAFVAVVTSAEEALAAIARARRGELR